MPIGSVDSSGNLIVASDDEFDYVIDKVTGEPHQVRKVPRSAVEMPPSPQSPLDAIAGAPVPAPMMAPAAPAAPAATSAPALPVIAPPQPAGPPPGMSPEETEAWIAQDRMRPIAPAPGAGGAPIAQQPAIAAAPIVLTSDLQALKQIESSGGVNKDHDVITDKKSRHYGHRAGGSFGLMPNTVRNLVRDMPSLRAKYYDTLVAPLKSKDARALSQADANTITDAINADDAMDTEIASSFWTSELKAAGGDESVARARWYGGPGAPKNIQDYVEGKTEGWTEGQLDLAEDRYEDLQRWIRVREGFPNAPAVPASMAAPAAPSPTPAPAAAAVPVGEPPTPGFEEITGAGDPAWPGERMPVEAPLAPPPVPANAAMPPVRGGGGSRGIGARLSDVAPRQTLGDLALASSGPFGGAVVATKGLAQLAGAAAPTVQGAIEQGAGYARDIATTPIGEAPDLGASVAADEAAAAEANAPIDPGELEGADGLPPEGVAPAGETAAAAPPDPVAELRKQIADARAAYADLAGKANEPIDPQRVWKNKSTGERILAAIFVGLDAFGGGLTGNAPQAWSMIQSAIADDLDAQKLDKDQRGRIAAQQLAVVESMVDELAAMMGAGPTAKTPPASMQIQAASKVATLRRADELQAEHQDLPWHAWLSQWVPGSKGANYDADRRTFVNDLIFAISGKAATDIERKAWLRAVPSAGAWRASADGKFKAIRGWATQALRALDEQAMANYGRSLDTLTPDERAGLINAYADDPPDDGLNLEEVE